MSRFTLFVIGVLCLGVVSCSDREDQPPVEADPGGLFIPVGGDADDQSDVIFPVDPDVGDEGGELPDIADPEPECVFNDDCPAGQVCIGASCVDCPPNCEGKECGPNGCGGVCGICPDSFDCEASLCVGCVPACEGKDCGEDGCGGVCGICAESTFCGQQGVCMALPDEICNNSLDDDFDGTVDCDDLDCEEAAVCNQVEFDCSTVTDGPFPLSKLSGPMASEDLAFDTEGNVIGSNDQTIFKSAYNSSGIPWVPNIYFRAGMRFLPTGDLVVCNDNKGQLLRIDSEGVQHIVLTGLQYPNGLTVDMDGWVYVTEHDANKVWQVDAYTGEKNLVASGITNANGVGFSPDYKTLYIGGFSGVGTIYTVAMNDDGTFGPKESWAKNVGSGWLDGIGVDICGNVYICDYGQTVVYRVSPGGKTKKLVINGSTIQGTYLPNMQWGSGIGGWDILKLYLPDGWKKGVFEVDLGVPPTVRPYP